MTLQTQSAPATAAAGATEPIWFASYPPGIPKTIDADAYSSLSALLLDACARHADLPAFECLGTGMTYTEWERVSRSFAAFLVEEAKFHPGDRIAIMLPNLLAYPVAFLGALRAGLTVVNVNPLYTPRELKEQLEDSGATAIVIMENFAHKLEVGAGRDRDPPRDRGAARRLHAGAQTHAVQYRQHLRAARGAGLAFRDVHAAARRLQPSAERALHRCGRRRRPRRRCCNIPAARRAWPRAPSSPIAIWSPMRCSAAP